VPTCWLSGCCRIFSKLILMFSWSGKDRTCIGDKRAIMCADCAYALPDDHEPINIATDKHAQSVR
jgi:hypothetical protein